MPVVDLTKRTSRYDLRLALDEAGPDGAVVVPVGRLRPLVESSRLDPDKVFQFASNALLILMQARPGAEPAPQDGRQMVRIAREIEAEVFNPTPEPEERRKRLSGEEDYPEESP